MRTLWPEPVKENEDSCLQLPCTPIEENWIIANLTSEALSDLKEGNLFYVVSRRWYKGWMRYVEDEFTPSLTEFSTKNGFLYIPKVMERPGPIDNSDILQTPKDDENSELQVCSMMVEGHDYIVVPEEVWNKLFHWYGGGPPLPRRLICQSVFTQRFYVEVYPLRLKLMDTRDNSEMVITLDKRKACLHDLYKVVCKLKRVEIDEVSIVDYCNKTFCKELYPSDQSLEAADLQMDQHILLRKRDDRCEADEKEMDLVPIGSSRSPIHIARGLFMFDGHPRRHNPNVYHGCSFSSGIRVRDDWRARFGRNVKLGRVGLAGLDNLGNTCFMNSALQCLVHTPLLVDYFSGDYHRDINKENPLGMQGELAHAFGELLRAMWSPRLTPIAPYEFKAKVAQYAPQFSGYDQHDSQELLAFLLDGLHEDLNRVKEKPYVELKDSDDRVDKEYADECWRIHKARNDSVIVDVCQGQYKSTLVCSVCNKVSMTFDPYMYLSLPIPPVITRTMTVTVINCDGSRLPMPYTVTVPKIGSCRDLLIALSIACCLGIDENILLAEVCNQKIARYLDIPLEPLSSIKDGDYIVAYRIPKQCRGLTKTEIILRHCPEKSFFTMFDCEKLLGIPFVTVLGAESLNAENIDVSLKKILSPFRKSAYSCSNDPMEITDEETVDSTKKETCEGKLSFELFLADRRGISRKAPIEKDYVLKNGEFLRIMLDWREEETRLYDISSLEDLPQIPQESVSLFSCLEAFLKEEPLGLGDMWYCPRCKENRKATKKLDVWRWPEILIIHLKRFWYEKDKKEKLHTLVTFPIHNLDLSKYVSMKDVSGKSHVYELYATSNHMGGLSAGHYTAYAKLAADNRWYNFNDSCVSPASEDDIMTSAAYVLFYRRVEVETMEISDTFKYE